MKIGIASDSHNDLDGLRQFVELVRDIKPDIIVHLGDDSPDADIIQKNGFGVIRVPGVYEQIYAVPSTIRRRIESFENSKVLLTHTATRHTNDLPKEAGPEELAKQADIILYGHTHIPNIEYKQDGKLWINPGHIKKNDNRGYPASYAILNITKDKIEAKICNLYTNEIMLEL